MPIEMPKGLPFSVDTWSPCSKRKRHHFLTHAHKDHSSGISSHSSFPIYSSHLTKSLILQQFPQIDSSLFVGIEVGETVTVDDPDGSFSVSAFDANHCPGAIMFLFEGDFGNILHTGDCRLTPECLQNLPEKYIGKKGREPKCRLDYVFLDCTFGNSPIRIPSKYSATRQVINCIWKHPGTPVVYLTCDLLAQDEILLEVCRTFGSKIYVDRINNAECFQALTVIAPEILTEDASSRFQVFEGFTKFYERARAKIEKARANCQPEPLFIRPSAQWYIFEGLENESQRRSMATGAKKDAFGVWHVCYSSHSSREELEWALQILQPKGVISTTPSCRAIELDYVKKHCLKNQVNSDDPLWKLMNINMAESTSPRASTLPEIMSVSVISPLKRKGCQLGFAESEQLKSTHVPASSGTKLQVNLSPPSTRPPVTLFGRARLALEDPNILQEENLLTKLDSPRKFAKKTEEQESVVQSVPPCRFHDRTEEHESILKEGNSAFEAQYYKSMEKIEVAKDTSHSCIGSSERYSESLRKLYRSMNVPVPQPLPSLMKLLNSTKRAKRSFQF